MVSIQSLCLNYVNISSTILLAIRDTSGNLSLQMYWDEVIAHYQKTEIAFLDGLDRHNMAQRQTIVAAAKYGTVFVREIENYVISGDEADISTTSGSNEADLLYNLMLKGKSSEELHSVKKIAPFDPLFQF